MKGVVSAFFYTFARKNCIYKMNFKHNIPLQSHLSMLMAEVFWGLMAPLGKDATTHGFDGISMVSMRVMGGAILFWLTALFTKKEKVPLHDKLLFAGAAVFGLACNQCLYTIGLSFTSPVNSSIVTTSMPIFAMVLAFLILKEPITFQKALGVFVGFCGAVILVLTSAAAVSDKVGDIRGDLMCIGAQLSFALYLSLFNKLIKRYSVFTVNKWMFLWATLLIWPFSFTHVAAIQWCEVPLKSWWESGFVVFFGTYLSYILTMVGQHYLRPTVVSIYNYVQPIVAVSVSIATGIGVFTWLQGLAVLLVFTGVWFVIKSKSKRDVAVKS